MAINKDNMRGPTLSELEDWVADGNCETADGCSVELDGRCEHGYDSWLIVLGMI